jgi:phage terminase large subunit
VQTEVEFPDAMRFVFEPARYKVAYGGRGGGKSWCIARALLVLGASKPLRVLCAREFQASIADSVHKLIGDQVAAMGLESFYTVQQTKITGRNGT